MDDHVSAAKTWPKDVKVLSNKLRRVATPLRATGIDIRRAREGHDGTRTITITAKPKSPASEPVETSSASSAPVPEPGSVNDLTAQEPLTVADEDAARLVPSVSDNTLIVIGADNADDADDGKAELSADEDPAAEGGWSIDL